MTMRKTLISDQNNGKALEIRLETEGATYYVIIAGMTISLLSGCARGVCEPTGENEYMQIENETYSCESFTDYREAKAKYDAYKDRYID
jgi:hypothetical protein